MSYPTDLTEAEEKRASARLTALADRFTADGHLRTPEWRKAFLSTWMRRSIEPNTARAHVWADDEPTRSLTEVDPNPLLRDGDILGFLAQWHLPDVNRGLGTSETGRPALCLFAPDGSEAFIETEKTNGGYRVAESGPRRLWDTLERVYDFWRTTGRPSYERFGITATAAEQCVWLDAPDGPHRWPLPNQ